MQNTNNKINKRSDSIDMVSDEYDSDTKENEHVRLRICLLIC